MICPRCGVMNTPGRAGCSRRSGSLAPPPAKDERPLPPVLPITRRAELMLGRSSGAGAGAGATEAGLQPPTSAPLGPSGLGAPRATFTSWRRNVLPASPHRPTSPPARASRRAPSAPPASPSVCLEPEHLSEGRQSEGRQRERVAGRPEAVQRPSRRAGGLGAERRGHFWEGQANRLGSSRLSEAYERQGAWT